MTSFARILLLGTVVASAIAAASPLHAQDAEMTKQATCVSCMNPSGNIGRNGRSVRRLARISFSPGRPSRLKKPPGIFPAA